MLKERLNTPTIAGCGIDAGLANGDGRSDFALSQYVSTDGQGDGWYGEGGDGTGFSNNALRSLFNPCSDSLPAVVIYTQLFNTRHTMITKDYKIIVIDNGWVLTGATVKKDDHLHVTEASVIRRWGTTAGLGQLALQGVQPNTILDPVGEAEVPLRSVLFTIHCPNPLC